MCALFAKLFSLLTARMAGILVRQCNVSGGESAQFGRSNPPIIRIFRPSFRSTNDCATVRHGHAPLLPQSLVE